MPCPAFGVRFATAVGLGVYLAARASSRLALGAVLSGVFLALTLAPVTGELAYRAMPSALHERMAGASPQARVAIWQSFGVAVSERPLIGWGFGISPVLAEVHERERLPPERRAFLAVGHPHSMALQIWLELGEVGAALALLAFAILQRDSLCIISY
jgi:O-antigen ligase